MLTKRERRRFNPSSPHHFSRTASALTRQSSRSAYGGLLTLFVRPLLPTLVAAYLAMYIAFCVWAHSEELRSPHSISVVAIAELCGEIALLIAALSYWFPSLRELPVALLLALYVGGCASFVTHAVLSGRKNISDPALSSKGKLFVILSGATLGIVITAPLLYWGWQSVLRSTYAEA